MKKSMKIGLLCAAVTMMSVSNNALAEISPEIEERGKKVISEAAIAAAECEDYLEAVGYSANETVLDAGRYAAYNCIKFTQMHQVFKDRGMIAAALSIPSEEAAKHIAVQQVLYIHYAYVRVVTKVFGLGQVVSNE